MRLRLTALFLVVLAGSVWGQTSAASTPASSSGSAAAAVPGAEPYSDEEFPRWVLQLRRAEIIAVGSFPVAYLLVGLGYDYGYYSANGFPQANIPWPLGPGTSQWTAASQAGLLQQKNWTLVGVSVGVSLLIAGADWLLGEL